MYSSDLYDIVIVFIGIDKVRRISQEEVRAAL